MPRSLHRFSALAVAGMLAACGGGGTSVSLPTQHASSSAGRTAQTTFTIKWTNASAPASVRRRDTISPAAQSVTVGINGTILAIANRTTGPTQSIVIQAPVGADLFAFSVYDLPNAAGHLIGTASVTQQIVDGTANQVLAAIQAVCTVTNVSVSDAHTVARTTSAGSGLLAQSLQTVLLMGQFVTTLAVEPEDVDGDVIITGPGGTVPYTITSGATVSVVDGSHIALHPIGGSSPTTPAGTLTVAALGCPSTTIAVKDSPAIYAQAGTEVLVYDWNGNYSAPAYLFGGDVLVGYDSQNVRMIAYNATTGLVSAYDPTLTTRTSLYTTLTSSVVGWSNAIHQIFAAHYSGTQTSFFTYDGTTYHYSSVTQNTHMISVATATHADDSYAFATDGSLVYGFTLSPFVYNTAAGTGHSVTALATNDKYSYVYAFISDSNPYIVFFTQNLSGFEANLPNGFTSPAVLGATDTDQGDVYGITSGGILEASNPSSTALAGFGLSGPAGGSPAGLVVVSGNE